ncbi:MAG: tRNA pseudouridine(38-40) synthase TruA [Flavobacteriaceae bacterium]
MYRYRLDIEYDGTPFVGWQAQQNGPSVQQAVEQAIHAFSGDAIRIRAAGRTDTGVHARGQVAHADLSREWPAETVRDAINAHLRPLPVSILAATRVSDEFDARFSATARHYRYSILNRRSQPALDMNRTWWVAKPLNANAMADAAQSFVGHHDFTTFRSTDCQAKSPIRTIDRFEVMREGEDIFLMVSARSFLHNQVRSMAGSLKLVGEGRWTRAELEEALNARDRTRCGPVAPACGLYLERVDYPQGHGS